MNLNYDQSPQSLIELLAKADTKHPTHYIAVDFDGEVIIDPDLRFPDIDIKRYKFTTKVKNAGLRNARKLRDLHTSLMAVLNGHMRTMGNSDYSIAA